MDNTEESDKLSRRERKKIMKGLKRRKEKRRALIKKLRSWGISLIVIGAIAGGGYYWWINREVLPPKTSQGHIEGAPPSHIIDQPMGPAVQMHMIEHADGNGPPGVIVNYNCEDFECESDLIAQLTEIVQQYPRFVYLAPYPGMSKKLAITRQRKIETYDEFDKESLVSFIEGR